MPRSGRPGRSSGTGAPRLAQGTAALLAALGPWLGCGPLASCGAKLESPDTQIRKALAGQSRAHLDQLHGGTAELVSVRCAEVVTSLDGDRATVVAMLEAQGRVVRSGESVDLSYLGREKFHVRPCPGAGWCAEGDQFARLQGVIQVLLRREDAFNSGDAAAYADLVSDRYSDRGFEKADLLARLTQDLRSGPPARQRIRAWQIRVDRDGAEVGEDYAIEIPGQEPKQLRARYRLSREGERWVIAAGL